MAVFDARKFHTRLQVLIDSFVDEVYEESKQFPFEERFGATSQLRRAALSVALNYTEGFGRNSRQDERRFQRMAYASLKECLYLLRFAVRRGWVDVQRCDMLSGMGDEIARMLWATFSQK